MLGASAAALSTLTGFAPLAPEYNPPGEPRDPWLGLKMGIATYTFSKLKTDEAIAAIKRLDLHYCSIKDAHLVRSKSTREEPPGRRQEVQGSRDHPPELRQHLAWQGRGVDPPEVRVRQGRRYPDHRL